MAVVRTGNGTERPGRCQRAALALLLLAPLPGCRPPVTAPLPPPPSGPVAAWAVPCELPADVEAARRELPAMVARARALARSLGLPAPAAVEIAPVPDASAGMTFSGVIRLQPAPPATVLATLLHEAGHLGPARSRVVEEAVAELTRRALLDALLHESPAAAAPLVPVLVAGMGSGGIHGGGNGPLSPALYRRAADLSLALLASAREGDAGAPPGTPVAERHAVAARRGRELPSERSESLLPVAGTGDSSSHAARRDFLALEVAGRLRWVAARPEIDPGDRRRSLALAAALEAVDDAGRSAGLRRYAEAALAGADDHRLVAHGVLAELAPAGAGEIPFLEAWMEAAERAGDELSGARARLRLGGARAVSGRRTQAAADLDAVVLRSPDAFTAAAAAVGLAQMLDLSGGDLERLLDLAPSLEACGGAAEPLRAHALALAGFPERSLAPFARAAGTPPVPWSVALGWAEALAASGRPGAAGALLRRQAGGWEAARAPRGLAGAALLAGVFLDPGAPGDQALDAAMALEEEGGWADAALAEAARRLGAAGREVEAASAWARLLARYPASDHAAAAREALAVR